MPDIHAFYSDPHFGHAKVIEYSSRPFTGVEQMDAHLVNAYNACIEPGHVVLWLGDCFFGNIDRASELMRALNGTKLLVLGNHDRSAAAMARIGFALVATEVTLHMAGAKVRATHRPYSGTPSHEEHDGPATCTWPPVPERQKGEVLLHGHTHSNRRRVGSMVHVGVDAWDYKPAMYEQVRELVSEVRSA